MVTDELVREFNQLPEEEKKKFLTRIMPAIRRLFLSDPEKMIAEIMPFCREMMAAPGCDVSGMMAMLRASMRR